MQTGTTFIAAIPSWSRREPDTSPRKLIPRIVLLLVLIGLCLGRNHAQSLEEATKSAPGQPVAANR